MRSSRFVDIKSLKKYVLMYLSSRPHTLYTSELGSRNKPLLSKSADICGICAARQTGCVMFPP
jgi:hypothetical protein